MVHPTAFLALCAFLLGVVPPSVITTCSAAEQTHCSSDSSPFLQSKIQDVGSHQVFRSNLFHDSFNVLEGGLKPLQMAASHEHAEYDQYMFIVYHRRRNHRRDWFTPPECNSVRCHEGDQIYKPRGVPHSYWNPHPTQSALYLEISSGPGLQDFIDYASRGVIETAIAVSNPQKYGIEWHFDRTLEIMKEFQLTTIVDLDVPVDEILDVVTSEEVLRQISCPPGPDAMAVLSYIVDLQEQQQLEGTTTSAASPPPGFSSVPFSNLFGLSLISFIIAPSPLLELKLHYL